MEAYRPQIILGCVGCYFGLCIAIGVWAMRRTKSTHDFFMAGRSLGVVVTAVAVFSSTMSGFGFIGGPGLVYKMGVSSFWIVTSTVIGYTLCFFLLGRRLREAAIEHDAISLPDVIRGRYDSNAAAALTAIAILLGVLGYLATQILAMATVLQTLLQDMNFVGALGLEYCAAFSMALLVFYSVTGGIIAGVYTDLVQGIIMIVASALVFLAAMSAVDGGFAGMTQTIMSDAPFRTTDPDTMSPWGTRGMLSCLSWYFVFALGVAGQPHVITKLMMTRNADDVRHTLPMTIAGYAVTAMLWISIGLAMRALVLQGVHPELSSPDQAAPQFLQSYTHPLLAGIVFAGLFAAIMSTADSFLNIGTAAIVHDLPQSVTGRSLPNELLWARIATVLIALLATIFALYTGDLVALLGVFGWGTFAAAIVPTVAIGLNWDRATPAAACTAIVASLLINFVLKVGKIALPFQLDTGFIALLASLTLFIVVSLLSKQKV